VIDLLVLALHDGRASHRMLPTVYSSTVADLLVTKRSKQHTYCLASLLLCAHALQVERKARWEAARIEREVEEAELKAEDEARARQKLANTINSSSAAAAAAAAANDDPLSSFLSDVKGEAEGPVMHKVATTVVQCSVHISLSRVVSGHLVSLALTYSDHCAVETVSKHHHFTVCVATPAQFESLLLQRAELYPLKLTN
jgi:hypothetical protein